MTAAIARRTPLVYARRMRARAAVVVAALVGGFAPEADAAEPPTAVSPSELPPSEVVPPTAAPPTGVEPTPPVATPPVEAPPVEAAPVEDPPPAATRPIVTPPVETPPQPELVLEPSRPLFPPPRYDGRRLLIATYALTGISWTFRLTGIAAGLGGCARDVCIERRADTFTAFSILAPITQLGALGVVGFGAGFKGRYDAWRWATTGKPERNSVAYIAIGAVTSVVFLGGSLALRLAVFDRCIDRCTKAQLAGYFLAEQVSDTMLTLGGGLLDYGRGYRRARFAYLDRMSLGPWHPRGGAGLALSGRF